MRARRPLSGEERRLWAAVARSVRPLPGRAEPPAPEPAPPAAPPAEEARPSPPSGPAAAPPPRPSPPRLPPLAPLERRAVRDLARGRRAAEATLDLHGLTQAEAHRRLHAFLRRAQAEGRSLTLVITGRGASRPAGEAGERGVLRRSVPHWLRLPELRPLVLGFEEAGPRQGGAGALYVRLRRAGRGGSA